MTDKPGTPCELAGAPGSELVVEDNRMPVETAGISRKLRVVGFWSRCGMLDGVAFAFDGEGGWVISLKCLREIVRRAELERGIVPNEKADARRVEQPKEKQ